MSKRIPSYLVLARSHVFQPSVYSIYFLSTVIMRFVFERGRLYVMH